VLTQRCRLALHNEHRLLQNDSCEKDSDLDQSILRNDSNRSSIISSYVGGLCRLISSCRPCTIAKFVLLRQIPLALASNEHFLSTKQSIFNQESPLDHTISALMLIYLLLVWKIGAKAKAYALAFMLAMAVLWLPLLGDKSGVCKSYVTVDILSTHTLTNKIGFLRYGPLQRFIMLFRTVLMPLIPDCGFHLHPHTGWYSLTNSSRHVLKFLGLSMLFLVVGASLQQFAADSVLNVLPPSLALAAVINWALPQPARIRPGADEEAIYESIVGVDDVDDRNHGAYQSAAGVRLSQGSNVNSNVFSIRYGPTIVPDEPIELEPSIGGRSDADFVPGDDSVAI
jgi:hypothetical protein